ncbi:MAG TPA: RHS repeat-associated core domain-containing protein [Candidatus Acidoferrum sp.]|nr:RHS repeat-associated core domain-containing protein [Candidatus Acidoferrum sp.]
MVQKVGPVSNATSIAKQCFIGSQACASGNPTTTYTYDETGQQLSMTDPRGNTTQYSYADSYTSGTPPGNTNAYLTQVTYPQTNGVAHVEHHSYGYADGQMTQTKDENSQITTYKYNDSFGRLTETDYPGGGVTTLSYNDAPSTPSITTSKKVNSSQTLTSVSVKDGLGHVTQAQLTSDPQGTVYTANSYDGLGRLYTATNPYRSTSDSTYGTTTYNYDALNRTTSVTKPDGSTATTQYCGPETLVTDEAGHWRRSKTDGLGRLIEVDEPNSTTATVNVCPGSNEPIWVTTYGYDTLDDLTSIVQGGSRNRSFVYDSLKRLTSSTNPESNANGTATTYTYDANSNVTSKTDARGITTNYNPSGSPIDALNRVTEVTYTDGTPTVNYTYDQSACLGAAACYNIGRRTTMTDAGGTENLAYDPMGRELVEQRVTNSITKTTNYTYDLAGDLATLSYPSGRMITYTYDSAGRPSDAQDVANSVNYVVGACQNGASNISTGACYAPQGAIAQFQNGSNLSSTSIYNDRLQPCWLYATTGTALPTTTSCTATDPGPGNILDLQYSFNLGSGDNGNVIGITNNRDTTRTQSFTYDQVNRIVSGQTASTYATSPTNCWGESYTVDEWGNLTAITPTGGNYTGCTEESGFSGITATANNQLSGNSFSYDASGNTLTDGVNSYGYDAEGQIKSAAGVNYTYDGDGNRLEKSSGKIYWYGAGTEILDESDLSGNFTNEYVFFGGKRIAMRNVSTGTIYYYAEDMLGSSRTIVQAGATSPCYDADFYPFGGERDVVNTCTQNYKFEGKERDTETQNDDFGARYYSWRVGRWLSADWSSVPVPVPYANLANPQTLNLYAMVSDDPETFADLDGHDPQNPPISLGTNDAPDPNPVGTAAAQQGAQQQNNQQVQRQQAAQPPPASTGYTTYRGQSATFAMATTDVSVTRDSNGNIISTSTTTVTAYFSSESGHEGQFLGAEQTTTTTAGGGGLFDGHTSSSTTGLSEIQARRAIGASAMDSAIRSANHDALSFFPGEVAKDARAHPGKYAFYGVEAAAALTPLPEAYEGYEAIKAGADVAVGAAHLIWELAH